MPNPAPSAARTQSGARQATAANPDCKAAGVWSRDGGTRTLMTISHLILNQARLPIPPHPRAHTFYSPPGDSARADTEVPASPRAERCPFSHPQAVGSTQRVSTLQLTRPPITTVAKGCWAQALLRPNAGSLQHEDPSLMHRTTLVELSVFGRQMPDLLLGLKA